MEVTWTHCVLGAQHYFSYGSYMKYVDVRCWWNTRLLDTFCHMQVRRRRMRWKRGGSSEGSPCLTMQRWSHRGRGWWWPRRNRSSSRTWTVVRWSSLIQSPWRWRRQVGQRCCWEICQHTARKLLQSLGISWESCHYLLLCMLESKVKSKMQ